MHPLVTNYRGFFFVNSIFRVLFTPANQTFVETFESLFSHFFFLLFYLICSCYYSNHPLANPNGISQAIEITSAIVGIHDGESIESTDKRQIIPIIHVIDIKINLLTFFNLLFMCLPSCAILHILKHDYLVLFIQETMIIVIHIIIVITSHVESFFHSCRMNTNERRKKYVISHQLSNHCRYLCLLILCFLSMKYSRQEVFVIFLIQP